MNVSYSAVVHSNASYWFPLQGWGTYQTAPLSIWWPLSRWRTLIIWIDVPFDATVHPKLEKYCLKDSKIINRKPLDNHFTDYSSLHSLCSSTGRFIIVHFCFVNHITIGNDFLLKHHKLLETCVLSEFCIILLCRMRINPHFSIQQEGSKVLLENVEP